MINSSINPNVFGGVRCLQPSLEGFFYAFIKVLIVIITISTALAACIRIPEKSEIVKSETAKNTTLEIAEKVENTKEKKLSASLPLEEPSPEALIIPPEQSLKIWQLQSQLAQWQNNQTERLVVTLEKDLFETTDLRAEYIAHIETVAAFLEQNPELKVSIEVYSDAKGNHQYDLGLSERRATTVRFALMEQGISSKRLIVKDISEEENPTIANNNTEARVDIVILR